MPFVNDSSPRTSRKVRKDGNASCSLSTFSPPFNSDLSGLKFTSVKNSYSSSAPRDTNRYVTVTDVNNVEQILYGSGFDRGHEFESSFVADISALTQWSGNPFPVTSGIGPSSLGLRSFGFVGRQGVMDSPYPKLDSGRYSNMRNICFNVLNSSDTILDQKTRQISDSTLKAFGTVALSQSNPLEPPAQLMSAIAELAKDGLPDILGKSLFTKGPSRAARIADIAGEYLNFIFGYKPIVSDILRTLSTIELMDSYVNQWKRNVGLETRRSFSAKQSVYKYATSIDLTTDWPVSIFTKGPSDPNSSLWIREIWTPPVANRHLAYGSGSYTRDMRFTGAYWYNSAALSDLNIPEPFATYFLDKDSKKLMDSLTRLKLLGLGENLSELAWQLTPFSWMIDWFINIGDMLSAANTHLDKNIQLRYGYATSREVWKENLFSSVSNNTGSLAMTASITRVRMRRIRATPFGFGTTFSGLSNSQKSILGALSATFFGSRK